MTWVDWLKVLPMEALAVDKVKINVAEFLALLITCETFTPFCAGKITEVKTDNVTARS